MQQHVEMVAGGADRELPVSQPCLREMEPVFYQSPLEGTGVQCGCAPVFVSCACVCVLFERPH